jgi:hypothetical protein
MADYAKMAQLLHQQESLLVKHNDNEIDWDVQPTAQEENQVPEEGWWHYRQQLGRWIACDSCVSPIRSTRSYRSLTGEED